MWLAGGYAANYMIVSVPVKQLWRIWVKLIDFKPYKNVE